MTKGKRYHQDAKKMMKKRDEQVNFFRRCLSGFSGCEKSDFTGDRSRCERARGETKLDYERKAGRA